MELLAGKEEQQGVAFTLVVVCLGYVCGLYFSVASCRIALQVVAVGRLRRSDDLGGAYMVFHGHGFRRGVCSGWRLKSNIEGNDMFPTPKGAWRTYRCGPRR